MLVLASRDFFAPLDIIYSQGVGVLAMWYKAYLFYLINKADSTRGCWDTKALLYGGWLSYRLLVWTWFDYLLLPVLSKLEMQDLLLRQSRERCADAVLCDFLFSWKLICCCCKRQGGICCGSPENIQFKNSIAGKDRGSLSEAAMDAGSLPKCVWKCLQLLFQDEKNKHKLIGEI